MLFLCSCAYLEALKKWHFAENSQGVVKNVDVNSLGTDEGMMTAENTQSGNMGEPNAVGPDPFIMMPEINWQSDNDSMPHLAENTQGVCNNVAVNSLEGVMSDSMPDLEYETESDSESENGASGLVAGFKRMHF